MKSSLALLTIAAIAFSSCSSVYRTAQTPDDVYFSPGREATESYVQMNSPASDQAGRYRSGEQVSDEYYSPDDRVLRMRVRNPGMWSTFDDYSYGGFGGYGMGYNGIGYGMGGYGMGYGGLGYGMGGYGLGYGGLGYGLGLGGLGFGYTAFGYNPYGYGGLGMGYNNYYGWNHAYNPYYYGGGVGNIKPAGPNTRVRTFNPSTYANRTYNSTNSVNGSRPSTRPTTNRSGYNNSNTNTLGTSIRRVFSSGNSNNSNNRTYTSPNADRPSRTYQPATQQSTPMRSSSTGSGGSTGGGGSRGGGASSGGRPGRN